MTKKTHAERTSAKPLYRFAATAAVLLAVCLVFMMPVGASDPISISSADDLKKIGVDTNYPLSGSYILTTDITLSGEWTPIGDMTNPFTGTFDGNGKTISGMKISQYSEMGSGFFGVMSSTVKNLHVIGNIDLTSSSSNGCGGIAGLMLSGEITSCSFIGDVKLAVTGEDMAATTGGIAGSMLGGTISNCYSVGNVTASSAQSTAQAYGIAGNVMSGSISNCYALNKEVSATGTTQYAGKIANKGTLSNNFGWIGMKVNNNVVTDGTATDNNGTVIYAKEFWDNQNFGIPTATLQSQAGYLDPKFTLTYDGNGATSGNPPTVEKYADGEQAKVASTVGLAKTDSGKNYKPNGWNSIDDGTGTSYAKDAYLLMTKDETLYVKWEEGEPVTHTVTFVNETVTVHTVTVNSGETVTAYNPPSRTGYSFVSWKRENGAIWNFETVVTSDITLTAEWQINKYKISFHNSGTSTLNYVEYEYGAQVTAPPDPEWPGKTFIGWNPEFPETMPAEDISIYGQWEDNQYTISFVNTGDSLIPPITQDYFTSVTVPADPCWVGHTFAGWDKNIPTIMPSEDMVITAQWTPNNYTVKFNANGGTGTMADQEFEYGVTEVLNTSTFTAPSGKVFNGWNTKADGSGTYYPAGYSASKITAEDNAEVTLYAQWKYPSSGSSSSKPTYTVTFNANGGVGEMYAQKFTSGKEKALNLNFFTREGYTFAGWATSADGAVVYTDGETIKVTKSMTLYAVWNADTPDVPDTPDTPVVPDTPTTPDKPEQPTEPETPAPILAVFAGLGAAVILRRK